MTRRHARAAAPAASVLAALLVAGAAFAEIAPDAVEIVDGQVAQSVSGAPGDPVAGRRWYTDRGLGNCMTCHENSEMPEVAFQGDIAPALDGVGSRYSEAELRAILVNSKAVFGEQTFMPAYYRVSGLERVREQSVGKPILEAQQVEDVLAYLLTLKD